MHHTSSSIKFKVKDVQRGWFGVNIFIGTFEYFFRSTRIFVSEKGAYFVNLIVACVDVDTTNNSMDYVTLPSAASRVVLHV